MVCLAKTQYYGFEELQAEWQVCSTKLKKWLVAGQLKPHIWLPVMSVFELKVCFAEATPKLTQMLQHYQGFVPLTEHHCQRLFKSGSLTIRDFKSSCGNIRYQLPESTEDINATVNDLIILAEEKDRFEQHSSPTPKQDNLAIIDDSFCSVGIDGDRYSFGPMQASILKYLYLKAMDGEPWQNGKQVLHAVGSQSFSLSNVFKHKPVWRKLVDSDGNGRYRINEALIAS